MSPISEPTSPQTLLRFGCRRFMLFVLSAGLLCSWATGLKAQITTEGAQYFDQNSPFIPDSSEAKDFFGSSLTSGDFNGDGYDDVVISAPAEDIYAPFDNGGQVTVIYGSETGVDPLMGAEVWSRGTGVLTGDVQANDLLGSSLASGDFNNDLISDLAISVPNSNIIFEGQEIEGAGAVFILFGTGSGLTAIGHQFLHRGVAGIPGPPIPSEYFGSGLAVGDFDGDGIEDLGIGIPGYSVPAPMSVLAAGAVTIVYGSNAGLSGISPGEDGGRIWTKADIDHPSEEFDQFGLVLETGDFDADGFSDLVVAAPREGVDVGVWIVEAGSVYIFRGSDDGLTEVDSRFFHQGMNGIFTAAEVQDRFGETLTTGDFDGDGNDDLAIGVPFEDYFEIDSGLVQVLFGASGTGLTIEGSTYLTKVSVGGDFFQENDYFGRALTSGQFDGQGSMDLAVGAEGTWSEGGSGYGTAFVIHGFDIGSTLILDQGSGETEGEPEVGDLFGSSLVAGDFNGDSVDDLGIGARRENIGETSDAGAVSIFYGSLAMLFSDGFESGDFVSWSEVHP